MLLKPKISSEAPYGAFDLKINYQYNLLRATLIMVALAGSIVGALFIHSALSDPLIIVCPDHTTEDWGVDPTTFPIPDGNPLPPGDPGPRPTGIDKHGIPVPVDIDDIFEEQDSLETNLTGDIKGDIKVGELFFGGSSKEGSGPASGSGSASGSGAASGSGPPNGSGGPGGILPGVDAFIPHEITPRALEWALPEYPRLARRAAIEGVVWVNAFVDQNGKVQDVRIAKSSGANAGFEQAAELAAWKCRFSPAIQNGRPIAVWVTFSYEFILSADM